MVRPHSTTYYFKCRDNGDGFEYIDSTRQVALADYIGETQTTMFCDCDNALELVRFSRPCEQIVVHRLIGVLKLCITIYK